MLGLIGASAALSDWWLYLIIAIVGVVCVLATVAQPLAGILGFVLLAPELSPYVQLNLPRGIPDLTLPRVGVALVAASVLLATMFAWRKLSPPIKVEKAMLAFLTLVYLDLYLRSSNFDSDVLIVFDELATPFLFFYLARSLFRTRIDARKFFYAMVVTGLIVGCHGVYQYATFGSIGSVNQLGTERTDTGHLENGRAAGPFVNSVEFGSSASLAFLWGAFLLLHDSRGLRRLALLPALGLLGLASVLSLTRSVWLGLLLAILTVAVLDRRWKTTILAGLLMTAAVSGIVVEMFPSDDSRVEDRATSMEPVYIRIVMYRAALSMVADRPFFGYGRGETTFVRERQRYLTSVGSIPADYGNMAGPPHNFYLFALLQWGFVGLAFYLSIFYLLIREALALHRGGSELSSALAVFFLAGTVLFLIQSMFVDIVALTFFTNAYFIGAGVFAGTAGLSEANRPASGRA
jgi:O-antigen ligase